MDDKVRSIIGKVKEAAVAAAEVAGRAAEGAGKRAGEVLEVTKLNLRIIDLESEISKLLQEIGALIYSAHAAPDADTDTGDMEEKLAAIDEKYLEIAEAKERMETYRKSRKCQNADCGHVCSKADVYCPACGTPLE